MAATDPADGTTPADGAPTPTGDLAPGKSRRGGRNLPVAIGVGVGLAVLYLGTLVLHPLLFLTFVQVNIVLALYELDAAFTRAKVRPPTIVAVLATPVLFYGGWLGGAELQVYGLYAATIGGFAYILATHERGHAVARLGALAIMLLWVVVLAGSLALLLDRDQGYWYVMAGTGLTVTNDIGAYAFGRNFGRHRIAPAISPGKTWEGTLGALATTIVMAILVTSRLVPEVDVVVAVALAAAIVAAATLGDFAESLLKRDLGVKDLGRVFPGHGGVMDRIDALLFALPTTHLVLLAFGI